MSTYILVVDHEPDVEGLFRQQFRRDIGSGRLSGICGISDAGLHARSDEAMEIGG
jgi:hypothetical protein